MFPRPATTDRYFVECVGPDDEALRAAIVWLTNEAATRRATAVIVTYAKGNAENLARVLGDAVTKALLSGKSVRVNGQNVRLLTVRSAMPSSLAGYVVLTVWLDDKRLAVLDDSGPAALCAVPWNPDDIRAWRASWNPTNLRTGKAEPRRELLTPVVVEALRSLTVSVNLSTGLAHPSDRDDAIQTFRLLLKYGETYDANDVRSWAVNNGWSAKGADEVRQVAQAVAEGRRLKLAGPERWKKDVFVFWQKRARGETD